MRAHPTEPERFQIVAGERRFRAAMLAELAEVPTLLRDLDACEALERAAFAASHLQSHGSPLPHVAADVSVLRYGPARSAG